MRWSVAGTEGHAEEGSGCGRLRSAKFALKAVFFVPALARPQMCVEAAKDNVAVRPSKLSYMLEPGKSSDNNQNSTEEYALCNTSF